MEITEQPLKAKVAPARKLINKPRDLLSQVEGRHVAILVRGFGERTFSYQEQPTPTADVIVVDVDVDPPRLLAELTVRRRVVAALRLAEPGTWQIGRLVREEEFQAVELLEPEEGFDLDPVATKLGELQEVGRTSQLAITGTEGRAGRQRCGVSPEMTLRSVASSSPPSLGASLLAHHRERLEVTSALSAEVVSGRGDLLRLGARSLRALASRAISVAFCRRLRSQVFAVIGTLELGEPHPEPSGCSAPRLARRIQGRPSREVPAPVGSSQRTVSTCTRSHATGSSTPRYPSILTEGVIKADSRRQRWASPRSRSPASTAAGATTRPFPTGTSDRAQGTAGS